MKNILLYIVLFFTQSASAQITYNPSVETINDRVEIESVEITSANTIVTILYTENRGSFVGPYIFFPSSTYLVNYYNSREGVKIINLEAPFKLDTKYSSVKGDSYRVRLIFPRIAAGIEKISIKSFVKNSQTGQNEIWHTGTYEGITIKNPKYFSKSEWDEIGIKKYLQKESKDLFEGIYERVISGDNKYKIGVVRSATGYDLIFISSSSKSEFSEGDNKAFLTRTASSNIFQAKWVMSDRSINPEVYITFSPSIMQVNWANGNPTDTYLKIYPTSEDISNISNNKSKSGSGFLINREGYVVTNSHVIDNAKNIMIKGINGDFSKSYPAEVFLDDKKNDLAVLRINELPANNIPVLPFSISSIQFDPGTSVYCLGYPLRNSMGDEVKITNGIISSKSGFEGDITSYQISAPIQPGNSGGPLFDEKGNLIGIINAKHSNTDNVSYAIKSIYLHSLLLTAPLPISLPKNNMLSNLSFTEQIKQIKKFVVIIEAN